MPTIPTGKMERELRALYLRWLKGLTYETGDVNYKVDQFQRWSTELIEEMGGRTAALGALADFPVATKLDLSPHVGTIYDDMKQVAIQAGIIAGMNSTDVARQMFNAGMDKSFNRLNRLARTETVSAYWKNAWDSIADLPLLVMVWGSEDGPRTCAWCRERDGMVMESSNLRDHPNGRCTPIPKLRSQVEYRGSISADGSIYMDPAWAKPRQPRQQAHLNTEKSGAFQTPAVASSPVMGQAGVMAPLASSKYSVRMISTDGSSIYTEMNLDQPSWHAAGNTIREALQYVMSHQSFYRVDQDTYEFIPVKLGSVQLRSSGGTDVVSVDEILRMLAR